MLGTYPILSILGENRLQGGEGPLRNTGASRRVCKGPDGSVVHGVPSALFCPPLPASICPFSKPGRQQASI